MSSKAWFLHVDGEALGPFSVSMLTKMITQGKASITDFVWCEGLDQWTLIAACSDFAAVLPEAPSTPLPNEEEEVAPVAKVKPAPVKAKPAPAPVKLKAKPVVVEPEPEPEVEEVVEEEAEEVVAEEEVEEAPAPPPKPIPKPAAKPVAAKPAPKPVAKPKPVAPQVRQWRVPIDAKIRINGGKPLKVFDISEGGMLFERADGLEMGNDVKIRVESPSLAKALDLTAVIVRDDAFEGKPALGVEFTRMNPAHRRTIAQYVTERLGLPGEEEQAA